MPAVLVLACGCGRLGYAPVSATGSGDGGNRGMDGGAGPEAGMGSEAGSPDGGPGRCPAGTAPVCTRTGFPSVSWLRAGREPYSVAVGDADGDGTADLFVTSETDDSVGVFLGRGHGTFAPRVDYATGSGPYSVAAADLDGDGHLDLAVANSTAGTVSILLGNGDGTFQAKVDYGVSGKPSAVAVADMNEDGHPDLLLSRCAP